MSRTTMICATMIGYGLTASSPAWALDCAAGIVDSHPKDGDTGVPVNASLFFHRIPTVEIGESDAILRDAAGNEIPTTLESTDRLVRLTPLEPLAPETAYQIEVTDAWSSWTLSFETGSHSDTAPPDVPTLSSTERRFDRSSDWGPTAGIFVTLDEPDEPVFWEYEIALDRSFADALPVTLPWSEVLLGDGLCDVTFPDYDRGSDYHIRVRAIDQAGNASDWVQTLSRADKTVLFRDGVTGCSTAGAGSFRALGLLLLAAAARRRRS